MMKLTMLLIEGVNLVTKFLGSIGFHDIVILPQHRKVFEGIEDLAENIAYIGLIHTPIIGIFTPDGFDEYLSVINEIHRENLEPDNFRQYELEGKYYVLIAGERRLRACQFLWYKGCSQCQEAWGKD